MRDRFNRPSSFEIDTQCLSKYWGKARQSSEHEISFHALPCHCLDVAAVASVWWDGSANLRRQFVHMVGSETEESHVRAWVLFFVAAHDLGKKSASWL
jgi:CRISPR-associated endonuclease/helicase Cas3